MKSSLLAALLAFAAPALTLCSIAPSEARAAASLSLGDAAPPLPPATWHMGEPVKRWEEGKVYILDFWATWCKPCIAAMPHQIEVQERFKDRGVVTLGLAIFPNPSSRPVKEFVEKYRTPDGKPINYAIGEDIDNGIARAFMEAMNRNGIPTVMIIDRKGRLAWVGHPLDGMDEALEQIVAGSYDLEKQIAEAKARADRDAKAQTLMQEYQTAQMAGDWNKLIELSDALLALDADSYGQAGLVKYVLMLTKMNDKAKAASVGRELTAGAFSKNALLLNALAFVIVDHKEFKDEDRDLDLALEAATRANDLEEGKRPEVLDTLAKVQFARKDFAAAVASQEKAVALAEDEMMKADFQANLDKYKKAAEGE